MLKSRVKKQAHSKSHLTPLNAVKSGTSWIVYLISNLCHWITGTSMHILHSAQNADDAT